MGMREEGRRGRRRRGEEGGGGQRPTCKVDSDSNSEVHDTIQVS